MIKMSDIKMLTHSRKFIRKQVTGKYDSRHTIHALSVADKDELKDSLTEKKSKLQELNTKCAKNMILN